MNTRSRAWVFTVNNYSADDVCLLDDIAEISHYLIYGKEIAPTTGTHHLQGYIYFANAKSFSKIQKILPKGAHIEVARGLAGENREYCIKEGDFREYGIMPIQGKRNDVECIRQIVAEGGGMKDVIEVAMNYQGLKTAELLLKYKEPKRNWKPEVVWIYGKSGSGKTRTAYKKMPDLYRKTNSSGKWWDGYDGHEDVLIDDVKDGSKEFYVLLLELLDRYPVRVEHKGGSREFLAKRIYITSIEHPLEIFKYLGMPENELLRRIDQFIELSN